ncbi:GNAT family N-acetyltransferase [Paractinoplanes rishiriensis]|nr:GNAT family N-acetyltransferase [Actinoplanes rishiriensis]
MTAVTTALPEGWTLRRPTLDDVTEILALAHASDVASVGAPDYTAEEVREALTEPNTDMTRDSWVALDGDGAIVGWAYPHNADGGPRDFADIYVWPERGLPAMRPLLALMMDRMSERAAELGHDPYEVRAGAIPTEQPYIDALTDAGFVFLKQHARMQMSLAGVSPTPPAPPPGVTVRTVRSDDETEMRRFHEVIATAFRDSDHQAPGYDDWRKQVDNATSNSFDEWFVAEVDGEVVGALQSSDSGAEDNEGWVTRLATLRAYRKKGVGAALLRQAFAVYAGKGRIHAGLGVDLANPTEAARLYYAVGMTPLYRANVYRTYVAAKAV